MKITGNSLVLLSCSKRPSASCCETTSNASTWSERKTSTCRGFEVRIVL